MEERIELLKADQKKREETRDRLTKECNALRAEREKLRAQN